MDLNLSGKVALVAAASKGLGKAIALGLGKEGVRLAICARGREALLQAEAEIRSSTGADVISIAADISKPDDVANVVAQTVARYGGLDILVNNAGGPPTGKFLDFDDAAWQNAINLNLMSTIRLTREVVPHMKRRGGGRIINLVSLTVALLLALAWGVRTYVVMSPTQDSAWWPVISVLGALTIVPLVLGLAAILRNVVVFRRGTGVPRQ